MPVKNTDALGTRMKSYEFRETQRQFFPTIPVYARIDGRGFSNFTKNMQRPFDSRMTNAMVATTKALVEKSHALCGYTQSDEISLVWRAENNDGSIFFDGKIQKMVSTLASLAASAFAISLMENFENWQTLLQKMPHFDCRVIQLPTQEEAANMFLWRELDATKNAISMAAHHYFSHKSLHGVNTSQMQERLFQERGINFATYPSSFKRGTWVRRQSEERELTDAEFARIPAKYRPERGALIQRSRISEIDIPPFSRVVNRVGVIFNKEHPRTQAVVETGLSPEIRDALRVYYEEQTRHDEIFG